MNLKRDVLRAEERIRPYIRETPLDASPALSDRTSSNVFVKLENLQYTGSFKLRGAMNKLLSLSPDERAKGVVAASTGNHGVAVAFGMEKIGVKGKVFAPENASSQKLEAVRRLGADVVLHGSDCADAERQARQFARENGMVYISPYNDELVVAGQGTIGVELERQCDRIDVVFVSLGGGGLLSGVAGYLKSVSKDVTVIGCSPENSPVMIESINANRIVNLASKPTLSDGTAGGLEAGAITFDICRTLLDDSVCVSEREIKEAMLVFMKTHHMLIEGAAGVAIAACLKLADRFHGRNVVVVVCGANISLDVLKSVLHDHEHCP